MEPTITLELPTYGLMVAVGLLFSIDVCGFRMKKYGYNPKLLLVVSVFILCGMAIGAKLLFFLTQLPHVFADFSFGHLLNSCIQSGFVFYGGLIGAIAATAAAAKVLAIDGRTLRSFFAPAFALFHACGRVGCFFAGCCYGIPWEHGIAMAETPDIPRFPVQLAESGVEIIIFAALLFIEKKTDRYDLMKIYLLCYSVARFFLEFLRGDVIRGIWGFGLSTSQYISIAVFFCCIIHTVLCSNKKDCPCSDRYPQ